MVLNFHTLLFLTFLFRVVFTADCNDRDHLIDIHGMNLEDTILISAFVDSQDGAFGKPWNEQQIELFAPYKKRIKMIILKDFTDKPEAAHRRITSQLRMFMDDISNTMIFGGNVSKRLLQIQLGSWGSLEDYVNCEGPARKVS